VQHAESIGGFIMDEIMIAMCDMGQNLQKILVAGWNQYFLTKCTWPNGSNSNLST